MRRMATWCRPNGRVCREEEEPKPKLYKEVLDLRNHSGKTSIRKAVTITTP